MMSLERIEEDNRKLEEQYAGQLEVNPVLTRALVSFQANKNEEGYRWFRFKEGFSAALVRYLMATLGVTSGRVLDPFAGVGTTLFVASELGLDSLGIELLPIACEVIEARKAALATERKEDLAADLRHLWEQWVESKPPSEFNFPHLRITRDAFPPETEEALGSFLTVIRNSADETTRQLARMCALSVLEEVSYTRKDGQYLRWDYRSGRRQGKKRFDKGPIPSFEAAISSRIKEVCNDIESLAGPGHLFSEPAQLGSTEVMPGSCLEVLPQLPAASFDGIVTSPPYCNRYDYTRTYALELALLGVGEEGLRELRQKMLTCTVENREKEGIAKLFENGLFRRARAAFEEQGTLQGVLAYLEECKRRGELNNNSIPRMVRNYFWEMTLVTFECARVLRPGAPLAMVNDNVRYAGANIAVDLILSDIAARAGLQLEKIWVLPRGKGNSSQQMGKHGREELRKCVYVWRAPKEKQATRQAP
jgi:hypothetical protein